MDIQEGWRFNSADFSIQAGNRIIESANGMVMLVRSPDEKIRWHKMQDGLKEDDDGPPLFVAGVGKTLEEAIENANKAAAEAKPIIFVDGK